MKKKLFAFTVFMLFVINFVMAAGSSYYYKTPIYDWRGENIYNVSVQQFRDGSHVVGVYDLDRFIVYCFVYTDKSYAMEMYQILSRMNIATLEKAIQTTRWKYWFAQGDAIYYKDNGML